MAGGERSGTMMVNPPEVSIARLPSVGSKIFGRGADTAWLDTCWAEGANVASIVAFGGVGKSALVWDWLRGMQRDDWRGAERVYGWSFYSQGTTDRATSADEFISAALRWFGDPAPNAGSPWDKGERLAGLIRTQRALLVLDGVEPLQWGPGPQEGSIKDPALATLVRELGAQNLGLCVLTSRLAVREAEDFAPTLCRRLDLSTLTEEAGAELLRARGVKGEEEELRETVREYGGHSLALALLGSYLEEVSEGDVRRQHEIGPLVEDERLGGHARRVMAAYERLFGGGSVEVAILRMLGLFDRPADEGEIEALRAAPVIPGLTDAVVGLGARKWNQAIASLRRVGLLAGADGTQHKWLDAHPLVREHFGMKIRRDQPDAWEEGHRRLYEHLKGSTEEMPRTIEGMAPLYAAVVHGCLAGRTQEAFDDVYCKRIHHNNEHFNLTKLGAFGNEAAVLATLFDPPWERLAPGLASPDQALVLNNAGFALRALGLLPKAAELVRMGFERYAQCEDWENAAVALANLGEILHALGDLDMTLSWAQQGVKLAVVRSRDPFWCMVSRAALATVLHALGRKAEAAVQFEEAERAQKAMQPSYPLLYSLRGFRYCDFLLSQGRDVRERVAQTLDWSNLHLGLLNVALDNLSLGRAHFLSAQSGATSDLGPAASYLKDAVDGLRRAGQQDYLPLGLLARAALHTHTRAFPLARKDLDEALSIATRYGFRLHEADAHLGYARLALAKGDPAAAGAHLAAARRIVNETGYHRRDGELADLEAEAREMAKATLTASAPTTPAGVNVRPPQEVRDVVVTTALVKPPGVARAADAGRHSSAVSIADPRLQDLRAAYATGNLVVFAGAGISTAAGLPTWRGLATDLLARLRAENKPADTIAEVEHLLQSSQLVDAVSALKVALGPPEFDLAVEKACDDKGLPVPDAARAVAGLKPQLRAVITTNLDRFLERAFEGEWDALARATGDIASRRHYILKIHGTLLDRSTWVFSRDQYDRALFASPAMRGAFEALFHTCPILFVGCGLADDDLDQTFASVRALSGEQPPVHFALVPAGMPPFRRKQLETAGLRLIEYVNADGKHGEVVEILRSLGVPADARGDAGRATAARPADGPVPPAPTGAVAGGLMPTAVSRAAELVPPPPHAAPPPAPAPTKPMPEHRSGAALFAESTTASSPSPARTDIDDFGSVEEMRRRAVTANRERWSANPANALMPSSVSRAKGALEALGPTSTLREFFAALAKHVEHFEGGLIEFISGEVGSTASIDVGHGKIDERFLRDMIRIYDKDPLADVVLLLDQGVVFRDDDIVEREKFMRSRVWRELYEVRGLSWAVTFVISARDEGPLGRLALYLFGGGEPPGREQLIWFKDMRNEVEASLQRMCIPRGLYHQGVGRTIQACTGAPAHLSAYALFNKHRHLLECTYGALRNANQCLGGAPMHDFALEIDEAAFPRDSLWPRGERPLIAVRTELLERVRDRVDADTKLVILRGPPPLDPRTFAAVPPPPHVAQGPQPMPSRAPVPADALVDFLLFAPLEEERDALLSKLPGHRKLESDGTDVHVYFEAEVQTRRRDGAAYRVIVTSPAGMGPIQAAITASAATARWRPEHVVVVGIAGGLKGEVALGDVVVARSVADYTVGKVGEDGSREERWEMYPTDPTLLNAANAFREGWTDLVAVARPEGEAAPARHAGVIASGGDVIASEALIAAYQKDMPKLIGVEMEGGGVAAALHGHVLRPRFLMVRGVSDLADAQCNAATKKKWRAYARDVAAAYAVGLLRDGPVPAARTRVRQDPH